MSLIYTELYHDDFQRPNENPLDPTNWQERLTPPNAQLQLLSHLGTTTLDGTGLGDGQAAYIPAVPNDQYEEITVNSWAVGSGSPDFLGAGPVLYLRGTTASIFPCLALTMSRNPDGTLAYDIEQVNNVGSGFDYVWTAFGAPTGVSFAPGVKIRFGVLGNYSTGNLYFDINGVNIFTGALSLSPVPLLSGHVAMQLFTTLSPATIPADISLSRWAAGSVAQGANPMLPVPDPEIHITYTASSTYSVINDPDNRRGSSTVVIPNQSSAITVTAAQGVPQPGAYGTVHGRLNTFSVINNPA